MANILVVAAHPDDEVLGCGGTLALHHQSGDDVTVIFMADGETSRQHNSENQTLREVAAHQAAKHLGVKSIHFLGLPDNAMDSLPLLEITQKLEKLIKQVQPDTVYTHFGGDLNIDHRLTYQAVLTACRPQPGSSIKRIYCFEVASSTEWSPHAEANFQPQRFVDISKVANQKSKALDCYKTELRAWPHARSKEAIHYKEKVRGSQVGINTAEAFVVEREII